MTLILITGSIDEVEDPFHRLNLSELYYEHWDKDPDGNNTDGLRTITREPVPIQFYGRSSFRIVQDLGSGKTLKAMDMLSEIKFHGGTVAANLGLAWDNEGKPKDEWISVVQTMDDLRKLEHCTVLLDDIQNIILKWNVKEADFVQEIAGAARKHGLTIIITAQREKQIPPSIRDMASEWIVPIIRTRDNTRETPDKQTGYPIELISLHFGGSKVFRFISESLIDLESLFEAYSTLERSASLKSNTEDIEGARPNQLGFKLEAEAFEWLKKTYPEEEWKHLSGKEVFDIVCDKYAIDVVGTDNSGMLNLDHKSLSKHRRTAKVKNYKAYLLFKYGVEWRFVPITQSLADKVEGKKINPIQFTERVQTKII